MSRVRSTFTDDMYVFTTDDDLARIEMTRIRAERGGDIKAEIEIRWNGRPKAGLLHHGTLNLLSERTTKTLANTLKDRIPEHDWYATLTACTFLAKKRYREGEPPVILSEVERNPTRWLVQPIVEHGGPTILGAAGGTLKSMMCLAVGATVATGRAKFLGLKLRGEKAPVLYLDWETDKYAHANRLEALCAAVGEKVPDNILYRREWAPLHELGEEISKLVAKEGIGLVIVDSKGAALSGSPEDAEVTVRFFNAIRRMNTPAMIADHVTNETAYKKGPKRPFGSVYAVNMARNVWMAERANQEVGRVSVVWEHTKSNNGPTGRKLAWNLHLEQDDAGLYERIAIRQVSPIEVQSLMVEEEGVRALIQRALAQSPSPMDVEELVEFTGASAATVRARLKDGKDDSEFINVGTGRKGRWTLTSKVTERAELTHTQIGPDSNTMPDPF